MKRASASLLTALLLAASFPALAGMYGPSATLTVKQLPPVAADREILTPLPDESALPRDPRAPSKSPAAAQILGLLPEDKAMPPEPLAISSMPSAAVIAVTKEEAVEEKEAPVEIAAAVLPPPVPVKHGAGTSRSSLPFPPSAEDWSSRMTLGTVAVPPPMMEMQDSGAEVASPPASPVSAPKPVIHRGFSRTVTQSAAADEAPADRDDTRPAYRVYSAGSGGAACRGYTRTVTGRQLTGTACQDHNGVWRIADERPYTQMRVARVYHVGQPPQRAPSLWPALQQATSLTTFGLAIGNFWRGR